MSISQINGYSYTNAIQKSQNGSVATPQTESSSTGQSVDGVKKYDFTNISRGELLNTVNGLIKSGQMSLDESSSLVLLMGPKIGTDGSNIDVSDEKVDVFSMLQQSLAYNNYTKNTAGSIYDTKALDALTKLQGKYTGIDTRA